MDQTDRVLVDFGLTETEARVYRQILADAETSPYQLSRETKIPRTTIYEIVSDLAFKGIVELSKSDGFTKQQTKLRAKNPSVLRETLRQRHRDLTSLEIRLLDVLPLLKGDFHKNDPKGAVRFYPGVEGARQVYKFEIESRNLDAQVYALDYLVPFDAFGKDFINKDLNTAERLAVKHKYRPRELFPLTDWTRHVITYQAGRNPDYLTNQEFRFLDSPILDIKQRIVIQEPLVRIISVEQDEMWGMVIESASTAKTWRSIYEFLWQLATPVTNEVAKSWGEDEYLKVERRMK